MAWREWPLAAFTLLGQLATGVYLFLVLPAVFAAPADQAASGRNALFYAVAAVTALLGVGAAASFFHLGRPLRAPNALANLRTSWLSREILFELLFMFFLALLAVLFWRGAAEGTLARTVAVLAAVCGVLFLVSMARLYMVPGVPAWNRATTPVSFLVATVTLGTTGGLVAGEMASRAIGSTEIGPGLVSPLWLRVLTVSAAAVVGLRVVGRVLLTARRRVRGFRIPPSLKPAAVSSVGAFALRLVLWTGSGGALVAGFRSGLSVGPAAPETLRLTWVAFGLAAAAELLTRFEFYGLGAGPR